MQEELDFFQLAGSIGNPYVDEWKANGGRVAGFFCAHAPEELFWAADILPLRMRGTGSEDTSFADQYLGAFNCSFVRHTLNQLLEGELSFVDALLVTNSCDHIRRLFDICSARETAPFCHYLDVPHLDDEDSIARLATQLRKLRDRIESHFSVAVSDAKLAAALKLYNQTRDLLQRASKLTRENPPRARRSEILAMAVAASSMPKDRFNPLLERRLEQLEAEAADGRDRRPRLMIVGGSLDDPGFLEIIESQGADVVADQLCWGSKSFAAAADETLDPIEAIATRTLRNMPCPRMIGAYESRLTGVLEAVERDDVDGIIFERLKFCDLWGGEIEMMRRSVQQELSLPVLVLERDYLTSSGIGQLRTRVQAFLESLT